MKRDTIFLTVGFILAAALITHSVYNQNKSNTVPGPVSVSVSAFASASESPAETIKSTEEDAFTSEKNALLSELDHAAYPLPPKLEDMGSMQNFPDLSSITIEADPNTVATDEMAEAIIEHIFSTDTGLPGRRINDDWVKNYADTTAETVDEFRQKTKEDWQERIDITYHKKIQSSILDKILSKTDFSLSKKLDDFGYETALWQFANDAKNSGQSIQEALEQYNGFTDLPDLHEFKLHLKTEGERNAKTAFILQYIARTQGIEVSDALIQQYAHEQNILNTPVYKSVVGYNTKDTLIHTYGQDIINFTVLNDAAAKYMESQVKVTSDTEATEPETEAAAKGNPWRGTEYFSEAQQDTDDKKSTYGEASDYNYTDDYDDPDDFADEWADVDEDEYSSYEDAMDDAYDIWSEEHGD